MSFSEMIVFLEELVSIRLWPFQLISGHVLRNRWFLSKVLPHCVQPPSPCPFPSSFSRVLLNPLRSLIPSIASGFRSSNWRRSNHLFILKFSRLRQCIIFDRAFKRSPYWGSLLVNCVPTAFFFIFQCPLDTIPMIDLSSTSIKSVILMIIISTMLPTKLLVGWQIYWYGILKFPTASLNFPLTSNSVCETTWLSFWWWFVFNISTLGKFSDKWLVYWNYSTVNNR